MLTRIVDLSKQTGWFSLLLLLTAISPAQATQLRVAVAQKVAQINIGSSTTAIVSDGTGKKIAELQPQSGLVARSNNQDQRRSKCR